MVTREFTPAAGRFASVEHYDMLVRLLTREQSWRSMLLDRIAPRRGKTYLEIGCGTGTLAIALKSRCPDAHVIGVDPDPTALAIARKKAAEKRVDVDFREGFLDQQTIAPGSIDGVYCSLVLHQVPVLVKQPLLDQMAALLDRSGMLHIADYASQSGLMRLLFNLTIQIADGKADTQPHADGMLEKMLGASRFAPSCPDQRVNTPTGTIAIFSRHVRD